MSTTMNPDLQQAIAAIKQQQFAAASDMLVSLLAKRPDDRHARWLLVQCLESQAKADIALEHLQLLLGQAKSDLPAIDQIAAHLHRRGYALDAVLRAYRDYLNTNPDSADAAFNLAWYLVRDGQFEAAITQYEHSLELGIGTAEEVHLNIANIFMDHLHDYDAAKAQLEKALQVNPDYAGAHYNLGNLAERAGQRSEARANFEESLRLDPGNESALARVADTQAFTRGDDPLLAKLAATAQGSDNADIHFALGRAYEQLQKYDSAWSCFARGNALDRRLLPAYDAQRTAAMFDEIMTQCNPGWLPQFAGTSAQPVFICGMFRSGSTLLEQMLAAHSSFVAGGENEFFPRLVARQLPAYPHGLDTIDRDQLSAWRRQHEDQALALYDGSRRVTDKRPDNFLYIGLIKAVLPSAKIIVTERDWHDVATSIYSVRLGAGQSYATDLKSIRHYIGLQTRLVQHWATLLGPDLRRVRYEDLVRQPRETLSDLLDWLGEGWDERCLEFHALQNRVSTASVWQVREPLHVRSIGRWKHYEQYFVEVFGTGTDT